MAEFRRKVEAESRRRNAELRGRERIARYAVRDSADRRDFLSSGSRDLAELRTTIDPLAKRLAARLSARRRQAARGEIDVRKTLRRSLSTGGVPIDPAMAHRRPHRPDLVLLCDISGSVAGFSAFTMALMQALSTQFRKLRVFAFVSTTDEITDLVRDADRLADDVVTTALRTRKVLGWGASSSYGQALDSFVDGHLDAIGPRSTVLILGDARSNYGLPGSSSCARSATRRGGRTGSTPSPPAPGTPATRLLVSTPASSACTSAGTSSSCARSWAARSRGRAREPPAARHAVSVRDTPMRRRRKGPLLHSHRQRASTRPLARVRRPGCRRQPRRR
ncbi:VWA domain-containing protein [Barrientosiimonas endolithica]|uniref:VWA domain-containing protein n=1 Tax=Barrientosiimonas endolithica TaxID=1535208 RepID=A0ABN6YND4_9MICO|nr:VWA domain-containing protein [Barrientosiimonas endolithica]BDZ58954.1 hypothetical protein GCM10025872_26110 [Barrientosiimonas endolithica]